jgi:hypothetical protein
VNRLKGYSQSKLNNLQATRGQGSMGSKVVAAILILVIVACCMG